MTEIAKLFASFTPGPACPGCHQALEFQKRTDANTGPAGWVTSVERYCPTCDVSLKSTIVIPERLTERITAFLV